MARVGQPLYTAPHSDIDIAICQSGDLTAIGASRGRLMELGVGGVLPADAGHICSTSVITASHQRHTIAPHGKYNL
ncbi:hypothetical protein ACOMHN_015113 [Nucella lapillus]